MKKALFCAFGTFMLSFVFQAPMFTFAQTAPLQPVATPSQKLAQKLFENITAVKINLYDDRVIRMSELLAQGKPKAAVQIALLDPQFTNVRARNFAIQLSNKSSVINKPLDDMSALITGVMRDNIDFREILTANYYYEIDGGGSQGSIHDIYLSNGYKEAEGFLLDFIPDKNQRRFLNLHSQLTRIENKKQVVYIDRPDYLSSRELTDLQNRKQKLNLAIHTEPLSDVAGVLTTRAFAELNYSGGTNRRPVEYVVKQFLCSSMSEIANNQVTDYYVGRDISRFPGGDHQSYITNCKSCHTIMDSWRGAFAKIDFVDFRTPDGAIRQGIIHGDLYRQDRFRSYENMRAFWKIQNTNKSIDEKVYAVTADSNTADRDKFDIYFRLKIATANLTRINNTNGVMAKMNLGDSPVGFTIVEDRFVNLASSKYGWRGQYQSGGLGLNQFGQMIADSRAFSTCMVTKIFAEVCQQDISTKQDRLNYWTNRFEKINYQMRSLIGEFVIHPDCGIVRGGQR